LRHGASTGSADHCRTSSTFLGEVHAADVDLYLHREAIDTTTPAGKAMFQMMGVFAEFERAMIRELVNAGLRELGRKGSCLGGRRLMPLPRLACASSSLPVTACRTRRGSPASS
jgi:DNA invertase Pin-like site-specific DNA recombinase